MSDLICRKCHVAKPPEAFGTNASLRGGILRICKACRNAQVRSREAESRHNVERLRERFRTSGIGDITEGPIVASLVYVFRQFEEMGLRASNREGGWEGSPKTEG